jgi:aerobic carbon-monoxide dehydrogenase large subunit
VTFLGDNHGGDQNVAAELALDADGKFLALRWTGSHNLGAYIEGAGADPVLAESSPRPSMTSPRWR